MNHEIEKELHSMNEEIKHPSRYNRGGLEVWDIERAFFGTSAHVDHLAQAAVEYVLRFRSKGGAADLRKAAICLTRAADEMDEEAQHGN